MNALALPVSANTPRIRVAVPKIDRGIVADSFSRLSIDPYCAGGYRWRALSRFDCDGTFRLLPRAALYQAPRYNRLEGFGGVKRHYPDLEDGLASAVALQQLVDAWLAMVPEKIGTVSVHQIRTTAPGAPVPEGRHRDGNDWVGIYVITRHQLAADSGVTTIWDGHEQVLLRRVIEPGELVSFDDRLTLHYTSEIAGGVGPAWRDVLIFSTPDHETYLKDAP